MTSTKGANFECCMCGDSGLSYELFRCKVCQFRSQHRYCSNLYPKAQSYRVCNWCLIQKDENATTTSNSSNSSSPYKPDQEAKKKHSDHHRNAAVIAAGNKSSAQLGSPIKKHKSADGPSPSTRKRVVGNSGGCGSGGEVEERLIRRTRSEEIANGRVTPVTRHVFRNKVRRYKLLEEVSS